MQPLLLDASTLIGATSHVQGEDEDELKDHIDNLGMPPVISNLLKTLIKHMGDEIDISATHPQLGVQARITGEGLGQVLKTVSKYLPRKD